MLRSTTDHRLVGKGAQQCSWKIARPRGRGWGKWRGSGINRKQSWILKQGCVLKDFEGQEEEPGPWMSRMTFKAGIYNSSVGQRDLTNVWCGVKRAKGIHLECSDIKC